MKESYMRIITEGKRRCLPISVHELVTHQEQVQGHLRAMSVSLLKSFGGQSFGMY